MSHPEAFASAVIFAQLTQSTQWTLMPGPHCHLQEDYLIPIERPQADCKDDELTLGVSHGLYALILLIVS